MDKKIKLCVICQAPFEGIKNHVCCSEKCSKIHKKRSIQARRIAKREEKQALKLRTGANMSLVEISNEAKRIGMSYGQYVLQMETKRYYEVR